LASECGAGLVVGALLIDARDDRGANSDQEQRPDCDQEAAQPPVLRALAPLLALALYAAAFDELELGGAILYPAADGTNWTPESFTFVAPAAITYLWFFSRVNCAASNGTAGTTTALAPNCRYGAAITDISVTGPGTDSLTQ
jgi:hypothetical protein